MTFRTHKYNARKTVVDGITFDSMLEADCYIMLKRREAEGLLWDLCLQPEFHYYDGDKKMFTYKGDFIYQDATGEHLVDSKGTLTPEFRLKKKLIEHQRGIKIEILTRKEIPDVVKSFMNKVGTNVPMVTGRTV